EAPTDIEPIESLYHALQEAGEGNEDARAMIETNVRTDVIERTMKAGHIMSVDLMVDEAGKIQQHGQSLDSVHANSLRFAADSWQMRERVEAETRNAFRIQHHYENGDLEDNYFVVFSRAADNMSEVAMREAGFFTDTMSCAIQVTSVQEGRLVTESAFIAGIEAPGGERHDAEVIERVGQELGADLTGLNAAETIDTPALVPKSMMPAGAIDLVELADNCRGTFFGQAKPRLDYQAYREVCARRERRFEPKVQVITERLIRERQSIDTPVMATRRLHELSEEQMVEQAIGDTDIDPRVFGPAAAAAVEQARRAYHDGDTERLLHYTNVAKTTAESSSCPGAARDSIDSVAESRQSAPDDDCEFVSKKCPECGAKNVKTKVTKNHISGSCGCVKKK
ncbi:MAG TPA: hypothetical protein VM535_00210, partial [Candidatus Saccharimonadales bacterium]|nr:hypothetical protein [Candidatus Saccharimonadales bacterium]